MFRKFLSDNWVVKLFDILGIVQAVFIVSSMLWVMTQPKLEQAEPMRSMSLRLALLMLVIAIFLVVRIAIHLGRLIELPKSVRAPFAIVFFLLASLIFAFGFALMSISKYRNDLILFGFFALFYLARLWKPLRDFMKYEDEEDSSDFWKR